VLLERSAGYSDTNAEAANRADTLFNIGSIVNIMTKFCIARLWGEHKLTLDDTIGKFLPDYPNREAADSVTIRHLLTMTSDIGDFFGPKYAAMPKNQFNDLASHLTLFAAEPLAFRPGTSGPATTSPSHSACANWWLGCVRSCAAAACPRLNRRVSLSTLPA